MCKEHDRNRLLLTQYLFTTCFLLREPQFGWVVTDCIFPQTATPIFWSYILFQNLPPLHLEVKSISLLFNLGSLLYLPQWIEHSTSDAVWLPSLSHKRQYGFHLSLSWDPYPWGSAIMVWEARHPHEKVMCRYANRSSNCVGLLGWKPATTAVKCWCRAEVRQDIFVEFCLNGIFVRKACVFFNPVSFELVCCIADIQNTNFKNYISQPSLQIRVTPVTWFWLIRCK